MKRTFAASTVWPSSSTTPHARFRALNDGTHPRPQPQFSSELLESAHENLQDPADPLDRPAESLFKDAAEHDHELVQVESWGDALP